MRTQKTPTRQKYITQSDWISLDPCIYSDQIVELFHLIARTTFCCSAGSMIRVSFHSHLFCLTQPLCMDTKLTIVHSRYFIHVSLFAYMSGGRTVILRFDLKSHWISQNCPKSHCVITSSWAATILFPMPTTSLRYWTLSLTHFVFV